ncbi:MAG: hypothetical protein IKK33_13675 [Lachnospiraceae bacterium]|nr:hypothetical protein [Lachnospiraceae bacterium]
MKKFLKIVGIFVLIFIVIIALNVFSLMKKGNKSTLHASEEEIEEAVGQMGDGIMDGGFYLDGKVYQLPVTVADMAESGWLIEETLNMKYEKFPANTVTNSMNVHNSNDKQKIISVVLINPYEEEQALDDVFIEHLSMGTFTANKVVLPQGITWKSTLEEVKKAYGEPAKESGDSLVYEDEIWQITIRFNTGESGKTTMSDVSYRLKD